VERSISSRVEREQAPLSIDNEATRAAITEQCIRKEPTAAVSVYSQQTWQENFERPWVIPNVHYLRHSTEIEGGGGHIFCRVCVKEKRHGKLLAYKMHVTVHDDDPMQVNKYGIITVECHGCGFEQIVPRKPKLRGRSADGVFIDEYAEFDSGKREQAMRKAPSFGQLGKGMGHYDPRMAAQGVGGGMSNTQSQFLEEFVARYVDDANRRVNAAVRAGPLPDPNKWPV
jgi:hypothetical protein